MPRFTTYLIATTLLVLAALTPGAAQASGPQPPNCPLFVAGKATDHPLTVTPSVKVLVREPYGGLLPRNRLEFTFSVRSPSGGAPKGVAQVTWAVDGVIKRSDPTAPYAWTGVSGSDRRITAGDHEITVTVTPQQGVPKSLSFALTATDCQPASVFDEIGFFDAHGHTAAGSSLMASSSTESDRGPTITSVAFTGSGVHTAIPASARGRVAGKLVLASGGRTGDRSYTLRVPRSGSTLLRRGSLDVLLRPGSGRMLTVTGIPGGVRDVTITLTGRGGSHLLTAQRISATECGYSFGADIVSPHGRISVGGGRVTQVCTVPT